MKRRGFSSIWRRAAITAVMAYALTLQALLLSFGGAAHAATLAGAPDIICATGAASGSHDAPANAHDGLCCILGHNGCAAPAGLPPAAGIVDRARPSLTVSGRVHERVFPRAFSSVLPVGSRAPPRLG
jgi:hypothetical protein